MGNLLDGFFNLGNKATKGDPLRKSQFDYYLYWIVFLAFMGIAITYYYNFFFGNASVSVLMWAVIMTIFCWFNYYALGAFRGVYENMKRLKGLQKTISKSEQNKNAIMEEDTVEDMLKEFD